MWRTRLCTYMEKCHSRALEALDELILFRIRSCVFSDQCKSGVPSFRTFLTMYFPVYPVPPIIKIMLFWAIQRWFQMINGLKKSRELDYLGVVLSVKQRKTEFLKCIISNFLGLMDAYHIPNIIKVKWMALCLTFSWIFLDSLSFLCFCFWSYISFVNSILVI